MIRIVLFLAASIVLFSCAEETSRSELLAGTSEKTWRLTDRTNGGTPELLNDCEETFQLTFSADGTWSSRFTGSECIPEDRNGNWSFDATEVLLTITETGLDAEEWSINQLTETQLTYTRDFMGLEQTAGYAAQ